jgi:hypothetical protein
MISKKEYEIAQKVVQQYEDEQLGLDTNKDWRIGKYFLNMNNHIIKVQSIVKNDKTVPGQPFGKIVGTSFIL